MTARRRVEFYIFDALEFAEASKVETIAYAGTRYVRWKPLKDESPGVETWQFFVTVLTSGWGVYS